MKRFGLIGHPIAHSLSPVLFKAAYSGRYPYELIEGGDFDVSWQRFLDDYDGINVTAPFKDFAYSRADILSEEVSIIGATNLVVKTGSSLHAYNSDYLAILHIIREESALRPIRSVLVVGCGGAAKAAAAAAYILGMDVTIANRSVEKAESFASRLDLGGIFAPCSHRASVQVCSLDVLPECDMCIYCLPLPVASVQGLKTAIFLEANYRDSAYCAEFFASAGSNTKYIGGERWLLMQAVTGYSLFTGESPDVSAMELTLKQIK